MYDDMDPWHSTPFLQVGCDLGSESTLIGADDLTDLLAVLEEHEGWHGANVQLLGEVGNLVNVDLVEFGLVFVLLAEEGDLGGDDFAGTAPGGETIEDDEFVRRPDRGVKGRFAVDFINTVFSCRRGASCRSLLLA